MLVAMSKLVHANGDHVDLSILLSFVAPWPAGAYRSHRRRGCLWLSRDSACYHAARRRNLPELTPLCRIISVLLYYPHRSPLYMMCGSCGVCGGVCKHAGHTFRRLRAKHRELPLMMGRRPINSHLPRNPHTHPLPLHHTSICLSSVASSPRKSVRQIAQLMRIQWESRSTANESPSAAKPMWPFYVSGTSPTPKLDCGRGGTR